jgi:hypothetical protein
MLLWLVLVLVLVQICGLCPQKRGTRYPRPEFLGVGWTKSGQGNTRRNVRIPWKSEKQNKFFKFYSFCTDGFFFIHNVQP